jgi:hypothetical protein
MLQRMERDQASAIEAVLARITELQTTPTGLARLAQVDPATVRDFLTGGHWPQSRTRGRLEAALEWPPGTIERIAAGTAISVSASGHGVLLDLPDSALEGMTEAEKQEVIARAKAEALRAAREIRRGLDEQGR